MMTGSKHDPFPQAAEDWWTRSADLCPTGCLVQGAPPPLGFEVWCARHDGSRHGPSSRWVVGLRTDTFYVDGQKEGWELEWNQDGTLRAACEYKAGVRDGQAFRQFATWSEEGPYAHDVKHGVWTLMRRTGGKLRAESWQHGKLHGRYERWHGNGELAEDGLYDQGARYGQWSWWHDNGVKACERHFVRGEPAGVHRSWDKAGTLLDEVDFGQGNGRWTEFHDDGSRKLEGHYLDGRRHGLWSRWNRQGDLVGTSDFVRGSGVEVLWDDQGRKRSETEYREGIAHGRGSTWNEDGRLTCVDYYESGRLRASHDYDGEGRLESSTEWNGDLVKLSQFEDGELVTVTERCPYGTRHYQLEHEQVQQVQATVGNWSNTVHKGPPAGVTASRDQTERHDLGDLHVTFELVGDRVVAATFQVGDDGGSHRRLRFALAHSGKDEPRPPIGLENADVPRPRFELAEVEQQMRDGTDLEVELSSGRVTSLVERRAGAIVRHVMPDDPQFLDIANLRRLFGSLSTEESLETPCDDPDGSPDGGHRRARRDSAKR
jgi:antitoxin component YwqK of YwqJK toxin-antitoxin module